jgi:hypothetical protein
MVLGTMLILVAAAAAPPPSPTPTPAARSDAIGKMTKSSQVGAPRGRSLAEVARSVKLRFPSTKPALITNESLKELGSGAELTTGAPAPPSSSGATTTKDEQQQADKKAYWQDRYFKAVQQAADLEEEEKRLTAECARLERDFYSRDDPYQRDNVIKPAWDNALAKLRDVQQRVETARSAPEAILGDARRDGALPGWFREAPRPAPAQHGPQ